MDKPQLIARKLHISEGMFPHKSLANCVRGELVELRTILLLKFKLFN